MNKKDNKKGQTGIDLEGDFKLWVQLNQMHFAVARSRDIELKHYGLTPAQASVLYALTNNKGQTTQNEIVQYTMRQPHSVSTLVNRMVEQGLVEKVRSPNSSRSLVKITKKGRNLYENTNKSSVEMIFSVLSEEEKELFMNISEKIFQKARDLLGINYKPPFLPTND